MLTDNNIFTGAFSKPLALASARALTAGFLTADPESAFGATALKGRTTPAHLKFNPVSFSI